MTLAVEGLTVELGGRRSRATVVDGLSFHVDAGETLAIVGESGSGKSMTARAIMGLLPRGASVTGTARLEGRDVLAASETEKATLRGRRMGMVFQEPMTALNPVLSIGLQMTEALTANGVVREAAARRRAIEMLDRVGIPRPADRMKQYPHEFSGGMRQRVLIAMAMMLSPRLLIADEPTTALDVTVQAQILALLKSLGTETGAAMILITHDMGVVAQTADRALVMRRGRAVETADVHTLFAAPTAAYSRALLAAVPRVREGAAPPIRSSAPLVRVSGLRKTFGGGTGMFGGAAAQTRALDDVSFDIADGATLALVGESGSGKSTAGRALARLTTPDAGAVEVAGVDLLALSGAALRRERRRVQMIFQDPFASLDPRATVGATVAEPIRLHRGLSRRAARDAAAALLDQVGLTTAMLDRYPHEFSGGQRQRVAIARALGARPQVIVADEPTSALDVSVQARVLELLEALRADLGLTMLFISHDLAVVRRIADRVAVMRRGRIVEMGPTAEVIDDPRHAYTRALIAAAPEPDPSRPTRLGPAADPRTELVGPLAEITPGRWVAA